MYEYPPRWIPASARSPTTPSCCRETQVPLYLLRTARAWRCSPRCSRWLLGGARRLRALARAVPRGGDGLLMGRWSLRRWSRPSSCSCRIYGLVAALRPARHPRRAGPRLRRDAAAVHGRRAEDLLRRRCPPSVLEAARLDGASRLPARCAAVALPLVGARPGRHRHLQPGRVLVGVRASPSCCSTRSPASPSRIGLFSFQSGYETEWHLVAAASFIGLVPVMAGLPAPAAVLRGRPHRGRRQGLVRACPIRWMRIN